ncbi:hypothetical protein D3OALGA1CA_1978 [Olavius algarvensis associated proteobacterium Delta 3]|nr:hypothetical protein D3OALGA1CA_1978 [Olavius algarvensis associated proteobacterium Delta 3]CAB5119167.1 hypothetical protein D3OALGB2SA_2871 [Olavius algarvensis associated proteobacterium Delta 3]
MKGEIKNHIYTAGLMPKIGKEKSVWVQCTIHHLARTNWKYRDF